ncbi:hypothetical protein LCGC14_1590610, partial [marine sediment metagenome]
MHNSVPPESWEEVKVLLAGGMVAEDIAAIVKPKYGGPSGSTIRRYLQEHPELRTHSPEDVAKAKEINLPPGPADWDEAEWTKRSTEFLAQHAPLPPVPAHIAAIRKEEMGFKTPQTAIALFSDYHFGSKIDPRVSGGLAEYSTAIARLRLARWRDTLLRFTQMNQLAVTVDDLVLFALGDELEGHGKMFGTQAFQMDQTAFFQYMGFITDMEEIILSMLNRYKTVTIFKVYGNHGRMATGWKDWYGPDNMEMMAWEHIGDRLRATTGGEWSYSRNGTHLLTGGRVNLCISRSWFVMADIQGWLFYARHGHGIGDLKRTYTGAYDHKLRMNSITGRIINYMVKGHLHEAQNVEGEIGGSIIQNGSFVGPSMLTLERNAAVANVPSQEFYLLHPKYGLT